MDENEVTQLTGAMLTVFQTLRGDPDMRALVFVFADDGAGVGAVGYRDEHDAFTDAMEAMVAHATGQLRSERERARPQG